MLSKPGRYELMLTLSLGLAFGVVFFDRNSLNFLMPFILKDIRLTNTQIGLVASGLALTWSIAGFVSARVSDRIGRRKQLLIGAVVVFSLSSFVTGLATSFLLLLLARLVMGVAEGPVLPLSQSLMAQASSPGRRGINMGLMQNVFSNLLGSLAAPLVVVSLATAVGWHNTFFVTAIPGLVIAVLLAVVVRDVPVDDSMNTLPGDAAASGSDASRIWTRNVCLCVLISALMVGWMITGWVFLPIYFTATLGFTPTQMSVVMSVLGLTGAFAGFVVPALSDRFGRRPVLVLGCLLGVVTPLSALYSGGTPIMLTILVATGWMAGGTFSLFMATVPSESVSRAVTTTAMAICMGVGEMLGGAAAPAICGRLSDMFGPQMPLYAEIVSCVLSALLALALKETAPRVRLKQETFELAHSSCSGSLT